MISNLTKEQENQLHQELLERSLDKEWGKFSQQDITRGMTAEEYNRRLRAVSKGNRYTCKYVSPEDVLAEKA